jgi:phage-related protein
MATGKPVKIAILTDARDSVRGFDKAGDAAKETGAKFDSVAESSDRVASKGAQAAGALSGLGDLVGGKFGAAMQTGGIAMQAAADSGDLLNVITESAIVRKIKDTAVTAAQTTATVAKSAADKAATATQWALNAAMSANPIALVVIALAALVAAIVIAYQKSDRFRAIVDGAFNAVRNVVTGTVGAVVGFVRQHWPLLLAILTGPFGLAVLAIARNRDRIVEIIQNVRDRVTGIFAGAGDWLFGAGKAIIRGLIDGIENMVGKLKDKLGSITDLIPKLKGPPAKDARLLKPAGQLLIEGLIKGIDDRLPNLRRTLGDVTDTVAGVQPSLDANLALDARAAFASSTGGAAAVAPIQINVSGALDPTAVAQQIVKLLVDLARRLGVPVAQLLGGVR